MKCQKNEISKKMKNLKKMKTKKNNIKKNEKRPKKKWNIKKNETSKSQDLVNVRIR